ncbi:hypothetical protein [Rhodocyclus tenuis]|uniref:Uncharacterized protein n=1 Tax=Rhodocyclus tenuis TaxID=1066 RepID=A0A840G5Q3_RHOTE|nr:hypothetical protein [Rhodocyclus tenuis]MBB4246691.1 hypothetical protein [Rhodocyclus tenuis]
MACLRSLLLIAAGGLLAACNTVSGSYPRSPLISQSATIRLTETTSLSFEELLGAAAVGAVIYMVYDPLAPNWTIEERPLDKETFALALRAKSFRIGGDGESMQIFRRRAEQLQREKGYTAYRILDYSEGIDSGTPFTHRTSQGIIQLVGAGPIPAR